ncbi:MAG: hypothetical protein H7335_09110 [Massilia sp.]|nr:hypothetical protein [Massilia sp.]
MHPPRFSILARTGSAFLLSAVLTCAQAVELGDVQVRSHRGQMLSADIELIGVGDAATLQAGLASTDVYSGANIAIHPVLSALKMTIVARDGRRMLHLASTKVVDSEFVNMFFELSENGRQVVRQSTLWLTPDPNPASPVLAVALPAPAPAPLPVLAPAPATFRAPAVAAQRPPAFAAAPMAPIAPITSIASNVTMLRVAPSARPAACVQQFSAAQIGTCATLDGKNAELGAQIIALEDKVRLLSITMQAQAAPRPRVKEIATLPVGAPAHAVVAKSTGATPWLFITIASAVVFSLVGVLALILLRKRITPLGNVSKKMFEKMSLNAITGRIAGLMRRLVPAKKGGEAASRR